MQCVLTCGSVRVRRSFVGFAVQHSVGVDAGGNAGSVAVHHLDCVAHLPKHVAFNTSEDVFLLHSSLRVTGLTQNDGIL